jgi:glycosyltransferase involved in cell wall biosynthesis
MNQTVSFIVPAYNEEVLIGRTLAALADAGSALGRPFEIIVADDASTDGTAEIARAHRARVVSVQNRQIAATRNAGGRAAAGAMLIFVDADTIVTPAAVAAAVDAMLRGATGGGCAFRFDGRVPLYGRVLQAVAGPLYRILGLASGCFLFCTRQAFEAIGGFDDRLFGAEELAMSQALHRQGRYVVLREPVTTSGRKLRAYSARQMLGLLARLALAGRKGVERRQDIWYGERPLDPDATAETGLGGPSAQPRHRPRDPHGGEADWNG